MNDPQNRTRTLACPRCGAGLPHSVGSDDLTQCPSCGGWCRTERQAKADAPLSPVPPQPQPLAPAGPCRWCGRPIVQAARCPCGAVCCCESCLSSHGAICGAVRVRPQPPAPGIEKKEQAKTAASKPKEKDETTIAIMAAVAVLVLLAVCAGFGGKGGRETVGGGMGSEPERKWYQGGRLHNATMKEWRQATYANKLATAADFTVVRLRSKGVRDLDIDIDGVVRPAAEDLVRGLDAANPDGLADHKPVSEVTAVIFALMER